MQKKLSKKSDYTLISVGAPVHHLTKNAAKALEELKGERFVAFQYATTSGPRPKYPVKYYSVNQEEKKLFETHIAFKKYVEKQING